MLNCWSYIFNFPTEGWSSLVVVLMCEISNGLHCESMFPEWFFITQAYFYGHSWAQRISKPFNSINSNFKLLWIQTQVFNFSGDSSPTPVRNPGLDIEAFLPVLCAVANYGQFTFWWGFSLFRHLSFNSLPHSDPRPHFLLKYWEWDAHSLDNQITPTSYPEETLSPKAANAFR